MLFSYVCNILYSDTYKNDVYFLFVEHKSICKEQASLTAVTLMKLSVSTSVRRTAETNVRGVGEPQRQPPRLPQAAAAVSRSTASKTSTMLALSSRIRNFVFEFGFSQIHWCWNFWWVILYFCIKINISYFLE